MMNQAGLLSTAIVLGAARGIILKTNRTLLAEYGGHVVLTKDWGKTLLQRMGFVKKQGTRSKSKNLVENYEELEREFLEQVHCNDGGKTTNFSNYLYFYSNISRPPSGKL